MLSHENSIAHESYLDQTKSRWLDLLLIDFDAICSNDIAKENNTPCHEITLLRIDNQFIALEDF